MSDKPGTANAPALLPLFFKGSELRCLVVGGGTVALHKVELLLRAGAKVKLVAEAIDPAIKELTLADRVGWVKQQYSSAVISDVNFIIAATNDSEVNRQVSLDARSRRIPVNVVDSPELCDVFFPAIWTDGHLTGAISTGGRAPFLCREIRDRLSDSSAGFGDWLEAGAHFRDLVRRSGLSEADRNSLFQRFVALGPRAGGVMENEGMTPDEWLVEWSHHKCLLRETNEK